MAIRIVEVTCPECDKIDATPVELDEDSNDFFVNTICVECTNPYAIRILIHLGVTPYKLVRAE